MTATSPRLPAPAKPERLIAAPAQPERFAHRTPAREPRPERGRPRRGERLGGVGEAGGLLLRPTWRLAGAAGYLWFDIAALWATFNAIGGAPPLAALVRGDLVGYLANGLPVPGGV